ncbi:MAG: chorismate synthase [Eubacterium sp.]|nr:chorismate synthase [Eubacterium sp.]
MSSVTGNKLRLSVFGESHGAAIGCVLDGLPAGLTLDMDKIDAEMARRAPGRDKTTTPRREKDAPQLLSGVLNGVTTGAPLAMMIENTNVHSADYGNVMTVPRPSHSDYPAFVKYHGWNDVRGGGHFSGRLTAPLVFAGAVAKQLLAEKGVTVGAHILRIGSVTDDAFDKNDITRAQLECLTDGRFPVMNPDSEDAMRAEIERYRLEGDSVGGAVECAAVGLPAGIGGNMMDTLEGRLSQLLFAIPAVKGVSFGTGFDFASSCGSAVNDAYTVKDGRVALLSNHNGGILGGITTGAPLVLSVAVKPTPSIAKPQQSVNLQTMTEETLLIKGRHDPCIVPRAVPVVEAAVAFTLADLMVEGGE